MDDKTGGETEAGGDDQCFRCGSVRHQTSQCPAPGGHRIRALTDKTIDKRGRSEQAEFQMKLAILQKINPRIARRPGPPRKKRPRKNAPKESQGSGMLPPEPKDSPWLLGKDGSQKTGDRQGYLHCDSWAVRGPRRLSSVRGVCLLGTTPHTETARPWRGQWRKRAKPHYKRTRQYHIHRSCAWGKTLQRMRVPKI